MTSWGARAMSRASPLEYAMRRAEGSGEERFSSYAKTLWPFVAILDAAMVYEIVVHGHVWQALATMAVVTFGNLAMGYGMAWLNNRAFRHLGIGGR